MSRPHWPLAPQWAPFSRTGPTQGLRNSLELEKNDFGLQWHFRTSFGKKQPKNEQKPRKKTISILFSKPPPLIFLGKFFRYGLTSVLFYGVLEIPLLRNPKNTTKKTGGGEPKKTNVRICFCELAQMHVRRRFLSFSPSAAAAAPRRTLARKRWRPCLFKIGPGFNGVNLYIAGLWG
jgi:hypothetical protein